MSDVDLEYDRVWSRIV